MRGFTVEKRYDGWPGSGDEDLDDWLCGSRIEWR